MYKKEVCVSPLYVPSPLEVSPLCFFPHSSSNAVGLMNPFYVSSLDTNVKNKLSNCHSPEHFLERRGLIDTYKEWILISGFVGVSGRSVLQRKSAKRHGRDKQRTSTMTW